MKRFFLLILFIYSITSAFSQKSLWGGYEIINNMPLFYKEARNALTYPMAWGNSEITNFNEWRTEARNILLESVQNAPPMTKGYDFKIKDSEKRDGYEVNKIELNISDWSRIPGYLLIPDGKGQFPAIVLLHDHGGRFTIGKEKVVKPFGVTDTILNTSIRWAKQSYDGIHIADFFASKGYVVLVIDALFWGERGRKEGADYNGQQALASNLMQLGMSFSGVITWDDIRSVEFLASHPKVNPEKIGTVGFSMGSHRAWTLAAASDHIAASASICWMNVTDSLMTHTNNQNKGGSAFAMLVPNLRRYMDYPHGASIACPKPSLFFNGASDKLFPVAGVIKAYDIMHEVWIDQNAEDKLITKIWDEKHFYNREMIDETLQFFDKWLK